MKVTSSPFQSAVAAEIRAQFARTELPQEDAAALAGIHPNTLSRKLRGKASFSLFELEAITRFLGSSPAEVIALAEKRVS